MAQWPTNAKLMITGYGEKFDPSVERTEMERGVPKERKLNSQVLQKITVSVLFATPEAAEAFEDWYFDEIDRIGWFTVVHPRTGATVTARFEGGDIGSLSSQSPGFFFAKRDVTLEYLRG
ncbi:hypothetical protein ARC20_03140 [Stenotrophomonas panacihumi]|uniref:Phage tail protein n=1 Tax=Stenotrophomonas panacihumi TaxID=676599 RepID=A0A0R0AQ25_9GAMM|nr:hypothetical protein [Stenotrophomonas panacihumi]KRG47339.1 hypothetical protein ARC20_03140 [Stenotrophomonas panacihumi]PTN55816.1 hypothetical protein C9J98_04380 [Stenotrophomonas panacihumi]